MLDVCQQTATAAFLAGERSTLKDVIILSQIDDMVVNRVPQGLKDGLSVAEAVWTGRGRKEHVQSWSTNVAVHDPDSGALYVRFRGLNYVRLDVEEKQDAHVFQATEWKPDISEMTQDQLFYLPSTTGTRLDETIDLVSHKNPRLSVLEICLADSEPGKASSLWLQDSRPARKACSQYTFASTNAQTLVAVETASAGQATNAKFHLLAVNQDKLGLPSNAAAYDLVIVTASPAAEADLQPLLGKVKTLLSPGAVTLVVAADSTSPTAPSRPLSDVVETLESDSAAASSPSTGSQTPDRSTSASSAVSIPDIKFPGGGIFQKALDGAWDPANVIQIQSSPEAYLYRNNGNTSDSDASADVQTGEVVIARFADATPPVSQALLAIFEASGYTVSQKAIEELGPESAALASASVVLILDELAQVGQSHSAFVSRILLHKVTVVLANS